MGSDAAEFVNKVKDQVRSRQIRMSNVADSGEEHSVTWRKGCNVECGDIHGKELLNYLKFWRSHFETNVRYHREIGERPRWDQLFGQKFIGERIHGENCHWLVMKQSSIFKAWKSMSSRILCCVSGGSFSIQIPTKLGRTELQGSWPREATEIYDGINGESTEFEWNIFPGFTTLQLCGKVSDLLSDLGQNTRNFHRKSSIHVNVQWHLLWQKRQ